TAAVQNISPPCIKINCTHIIVKQADRKCQPCSSPVFYKDAKKRKTKVEYENQSQEPSHSDHTDIACIRKKSKQQRQICKCFINSPHGRRHYHIQKDKDSKKGKNLFEPFPIKIRK